MKPRIPPCTNCNHKPYCLHRQAFGEPKKCGYINKQTDRITHTRSTILLIKQINSITLKSPYTCQKIIEPLYHTQEKINTTCTLCAHWLFNCEGKKQ